MALTVRQLSKIEQQLRARLVELGDQLQRPSDGAERHSDPLDSATDAASDAVTAELSTCNSLEANQIAAALDRITNHTFGFCERCGDQIAAGRLSIVPQATCCVICQNRADPISGDRQPHRRLKQLPTDGAGLTSGGGATSSGDAVANSRPSATR